MSPPSGSSRPRRAVFTLIIGFVALVAIAVLGVAVAHRFIKTDPPPAELHAEQAQQGLPVGDRQPYGLEDLAEPAAK